MGSRLLWKSSPAAFHRWVLHGLWVSALMLGLWGPAWVPGLCLLREPRLSPHSGPADLPPLGDGSAPLLTSPSSPSPGVFCSSFLCLLLSRTSDGNSRCMFSHLVVFLVWAWEEVHPRPACSAAISPLPLLVYNNEIWGP